MPGHGQRPGWSDGQANNELLSSLDAIGGVGADLADQEVFRLLDEIEGLAKERLRAEELLGGQGYSNGAAEPRLGPKLQIIDKSALEESLDEIPSQGQANQQFNAAVSSPPIFTGLEETKFSPKLPISTELPNKFAAKPLQAGTDAPFATTSVVAPVRLGAEDLSDFSSTGLDEERTPSAVEASGQTRVKIPDLVESAEVDRPNQEMELGKKKKALPEDFLPKDFFDPRDRKPKSVWPRWLALGLLIFSMISLAGYLIYRSGEMGKPNPPPKSYGDLTKPMTK